jgi:predicted ATPase/DNA-binding winged helix-turn-helix (wHTH) protein
MVWALDRATMVTETSLAFGPFRLLPAQRVLLENGKPLRLGSRALDLLIVLTERAGELVGKDELIAHVWPETFIEDSNLRVHMASLRRLLGGGRPGERYIVNVPGRGYCFVAPVRRDDEPADPAPASAPAVELPAPLTRPIGRGEAIAALADKLRRRRFVTLVGPGGIGKTTVAVAAARELARSFAQRVCYVDLAPIADDRLVVRALASALEVGLGGPAPSGGDPLRDALERLRGTTLLVVLDNCEHVLAAAAPLAEEILRAVPGAHLLATSREPLRAEGEWVQRLAALDVPAAGRPLTAARALDHSAVRLFVERGMASLDGFVLRDEDAAAVAEICRRLDGIPLAIELAAARLGLFGVRGLAAHLDDRFALLGHGRRGALDRHRTLSAALDWSYDLLGDGERALLRRLSVFTGAFTLESAAAIAPDPSAASEVLEGISSLAEKSLLSVDIGGERVLYRMLDTTRAYAARKLVASGESLEARHRHAAYLAQVLRGAAVTWERLPSADWLCAYGCWIDDIRAALAHAFSPGGDATLGVDLVVASAPIWSQLARLEEYRARVEAALAMIGEASGPQTRDGMRLSLALGYALWHTNGEMTAMETTFRRALAAAEALRDTVAELQALWGLWAVRRKQGDFQSAKALAELYRDAAFRLGERAGERDFVPLGDRMLALTGHFAGDWDAAPARPEADETA